MPQIVANYKFNSKQPNFARDQVQTMAELLSYGGWNEGDERYPNDASLTKIDIGHVTFVVETNQHYTYVKIDELDDNKNVIGHHYGWVEFNGAGGGEVNPGGTTPTDPSTLGLHAYFKSLVFKRCNVSNPPSRPGTGIVEGDPDFGGTFAVPVPYGWSDGIPPKSSEENGTDVIWMTTRVFSSGGNEDSSQQDHWTDPEIIGDTEGRDFEFSELETLDPFSATPNKAHPWDEATNGWSNVATERTIWMAMKDKEGGDYRPGAEWEVVKIKGEDGEQAVKVRVKGVKDSYDEVLAETDNEYLDAWLVGDILYVWDGDSWVNSGHFKGQFDSTKTWAYLHIKYSNDGIKFTAAGGEVPGKWVGTYCDYVIQDSRDFDYYTWNCVAGQDGFGYEYIFYLTKTDQAPEVPNDTANTAGDTWEDFDFVPENWSDDPISVNETWRWCWVCHRVFQQGHWSTFKGAGGANWDDWVEGQPTPKAVLWSHYGGDAVASSASRSFMIFTWTSLDEEADPKTPFVPVKPADDVARWNVIENTLEVNEGKSLNWSSSSASGVWNVNPGNSRSESLRFLWMTTATFSEAEEGGIVGTWSDPVCLTGEDGRNGTDGEWTAFGYHICEDMDEFDSLSRPVLQNPLEVDSFDPSSGWVDHPQGISPAFPIEAASIAIRDRETKVWTYTNPFIWARWGEDGIDGDGIEYLFYVATENDVDKEPILDTDTEEEIGQKIKLKNINWLPQNEVQLREFLSGRGITGTALDTAVDNYYNDHYHEWLPSGTGWTDDPSDVGPYQPYEFVSIRKFGYDSTAPGETEKDKFRWGFWSTPRLWNRYAKDGKSGYSVFTSIVFARTNTDISNAVITGGTIEDPRPTSTKINGEEVSVSWQDTVPETPYATVWMTSAIFGDESTGEETGWKSPTRLQDSPNFQVEYTDEEVWEMEVNGVSTLPDLNNYTTDANEEGIDEVSWRRDAKTYTHATWGDIHGDGTHEDDIVNPWWMITSRRDMRGVWSPWAVFRVKGEKGETGTSISVKGSLDSYRDLGDLEGNPAGRVDHVGREGSEKVSMGDCYVINGLLWIYDDNATKTSPYTTDYVTDSEGTGQIQGNKYAGFSCQGQFKGDPGENSWIHVKFANESEDQTTPITSEGNNPNNWYRYRYNDEVFIEFTGGAPTWPGTIPGKYAGIAITHVVNTPPTSIEEYEWTEWRGDDLYGTEQIFTLSTERPAAPRKPSGVSDSDWYKFDYVPTVPIAGTDPVEYQVWSDTPLQPTPDEFCWVSTRRLSDPEDKEWKTPVIYTRYAKDGVDGLVTENIYHLGREGVYPEINLSVGKRGSDETVSGKTYANFWKTDDSRDFRPGDNSNDYWTDNPVGITDTPDTKVEYYSQRYREYNDNTNTYEWTEWKPVKIWSAWGKQGRDGDGVEYIFALTRLFETPNNPTPYKTVSGERVIDTDAVDGDGHSWSDFDYAPRIEVPETYTTEDEDLEYWQWTDDPNNVGPEWKYQWVSMRTSHPGEDGRSVWTAFSDPVEWNRFTQDGKDGKTEEYVYFSSSYDSNGNEIIPELDIYRAAGYEDGVYKVYGGSNGDPNLNWQELSDFAPGLANPEDFGNRFSGQNPETIFWNDNPVGISRELPLEYQARRYKKDGVWSEWQGPIRWSAWGLDGTDGDGVEYVFTRTANSTVVPNLNTPEAFADHDGMTWTKDDYVPKVPLPGTDQYQVWTDDPMGVTSTLRTEWVSIRKTFEGAWATDDVHKKWSDPKIWKEFDEHALEEKVYHYGGRDRDNDPTLVQTVDYRGRTTIDGVAVDTLDGFIPTDKTSAPYYDGDGNYDPDGWTPFKKGISPENKYEWEAIRTKDPITGAWSEFRMALVEAWGEDGPGSEFVFFLLTSTQHEWVQQCKANNREVVPDSDVEGTPNVNGKTPADDDYLPEIVLFNNDADSFNDVHIRALDNMEDADMTSEYPYLYASRRKKNNGVWGDFCGIWLYNQLFVATEYSCTLNLDEDAQGVAVYPDDDHFTSYLNHNSMGLTIAELRYGSSAQIINKVSVVPVVKTISGDSINISMDPDNAQLIWQAGDTSHGDTTITLGGNSVKVSVDKSDTFYTVWFSWSASKLEFMKDSNGDPVDLSFVLYAYGSTSEGAGATERCGTATFNIHPIVGDTVYELDPWDDIFKKRDSGAPYNLSGLSSFFWKHIYEVGGGQTYYRVNGTDWNTSQDTDDEKMKLVYWIDDHTDDAVVIQQKLNQTKPNSTDIYCSATDPDGKYSWKLEDNTGSDGDKYLYFTINLYKSSSGGIYTDYVEGVEDGITCQLWVGNQLHDEEFIPVVYNGKKGKRGDYYKDQWLYHLADSPNFNTLPGENEAGSDPSGNYANDAQVWLKSVVSPNATYRYLFATKRLNRYAGDTDEENDITVDEILEAGTWEPLFVYASRSVDGTVGYGSPSTPGNPGRGVSEVHEYYQWTEENIAPAVLSDSDILNDTLGNWTKDSIPTAGESDKYLWNFEVISYTDDSISKTSVAPAGNISSDGSEGNGVQKITDFYYWSDENTSHTGTYPDYTDRTKLNNSSIENSWWSSEYHSELENQVSETRRYLWNFERIFYTKGSNAFNHQGLVGSESLEQSNPVSDINLYFLWTSTSTLSSEQQNSAASNDPASSSLSESARWYKSLGGYDIPVSLNENFGSNYFWYFLKIDYEGGGSERTSPSSVDGDESDFGTVRPGTHLAGVFCGLRVNGMSWKVNLHEGKDEIISAINSLPTSGGAFRQVGLDFRVHFGKIEVTEPALISQNGSNGRSVTGITEYYQWTSDNAAPAKTPLSNWSAGSVPTAGTSDKYLWNYEVITYSSAPLTSDSDVECVGNISDDGVSVTGFAEFYYWGTNIMSSLPAKTLRSNNSSSWCDTSHQSELAAQVSDTRKYLWNFEEITYSDGHTSSTDPIIVGQNGDDGISVSGIKEWYKWSADDSGVTNTSSGWTQDAIPENSSNLKYLWNYEEISFSSGSPKKTDPTIVSTVVKDGVSVTGFTEYYFWSHLSSGSAGTYDVNGSTYAYPAKTSIGEASSKWTTSQSTLANQMSDSRRYLWNWEKVTYSDGSTTDTWSPVIIAVNGEVGNGILSVDEYYLWTSGKTLSDTQIAAETSGTGGAPNETVWSKNAIPTEDETKPYLWNFEILTYTDGATVRTTAAIISSLGKGIKTVVEKYQWSSKDGSSGNQLTSSQGTWYGTNQMSALAAQASETNKYLWNYEIVTYSDDSSVPTTPIIISVRGTKGDDGKYSQFVYFRSKSDLSSLTYSQVTSGSSPVLYTFTGSGEKVPVFKYGSYYISPNSDDVEGTVSSTYTARPSGSPFYVTSSDKAYITDDPLGVNDDWRYEYESMGTMDDNGNWIFSKPALHNYKATDGQSGNTRVELFKVSATLNTAPTLSNNEATRDALVADGWMPLGIALSAGQALGVSDYDIWMIYATYAGDGSEDSLAKVWVGPSLYNAIRKGEPGDSITGPAVRGPVEWTNASRRWCAGKDSTPVSSQNHAEDVAWIDVVTYNGSYYVCKESHTGPQTPSDSSNYWDKDTSGKYKFIAAEVLVADAGAIDVLKSGSLLLRDNSDNVVGGAKGTDSATGTIFWAGGTYSNGTISGAPFVVNKAGAMTSSSGTVGGWTINPDSLSATGSQAWNSAQNKFMPELPKLSITTTRTSSVSTVNMSVSLRDSGITGTYSSTPKSSSSLGSYSGTFNLDPQMLSFSGNYSSDTSVKDYTTTLTYSDITFDSSYDTQGTQFEDFLNISSVNGIQLRQKVDGSIYKEARLTKDRLEIESVYASSSISSSGDIYSAGTISALDGFTIEDYARPRSVTSSIGMLPLRIAIVVDDFSTAQSMFSDSGTTWKFNGGDTGVSTSEYPTLSTSSLPTGGTQVVYLTSSSVHLGTGVVLKTNLTRVGNTIYIEI